jgi:hypothetical protein
MALLSKRTINEKLKAIAENHNMTGDSVELLIDELTYSLYHEQLEIANALQEDNLSTAVLLNSKIRSCMNVMYSVYRGRNVRVRLEFLNDVKLIADKYDVLYRSNTFKVYAAESFDLPVRQFDANGGSQPNVIIGILATKDLHENTIQITESNRYYVDFKLNRDLLANLSEDVQIFYGYDEDHLKEYPITRDFYDFIKQDKDENEEDGYRPSLFVLTLPDYGIRVYRRGYFDTNALIRIRAFHYTTVNDINSDEFAKIQIPGTQLVQYVDGEWRVGVRGTLSIDNVVLADEYITVDENGFPAAQWKGNKIIKSITQNYNGNGVIREVSRDNERSLMLSANYYERLQGQILSKSDINLLFNEYFIDKVHSSISWYDGTEEFANGKVFLFYIPRILRDTIDDGPEFDEFRKKYGSYFISTQLVPQPAKSITIHGSITLYVNDTQGVSDQIDAIYKQYVNQLNDPNKYNKIGSENNDLTNVFQPKKIFSAISKLEKVSYIDELVYTEFTDTENGTVISEQYYGEDLANGMPPRYVLETIGDVQVKVPTYYVFSIDKVLKSNNEIIS